MNFSNRENSEQLVIKSEPGPEILKITTAKV